MLDVLEWSGAHAGLVFGLCLGVGVGGLLLMSAYQVALALAKLRVWWRGGTWLGRQPSGGAGGHTHSAEYRAVMQSAGWRRRRSQAIRAAGRRCQECGAGGPLDVHHLSYAHLGDERPYELAVLCEGCHARAHGR